MYLIKYESQLYFNFFFKATKSLKFKNIRNNTYTYNKNSCIFS